MNTVRWAFILPAFLAAQTPPGIVLRSSLTGNGRYAAPESLLSAYAGTAPLATAEFSGDPRNPQTALGGTTVRIVDSAGVERMAPLLYVSPKQVNMVLPKDTATGSATLTIASGNQDVSRAVVEVRAVAPELMQAGTYPVALLMRVRDGTRTFEPITRIQNGSVEPVPIDFGPPTDELFLLLFGTGLRGRTSLASVKALIGDLEVPAEYAGPQGEVAGLDQVNIRLPRSLAAGPSKFPYFTLVVDGTRLANDDGDNMYLPVR
jgi:uncharacterized protein (TIGR03437 family)